jgi:gamma-glutamyltranspeptidase/glutathione hydrolase
MFAGRPVTIATHGMVASPHYLATAAGLRILQQGGNAVDAAVATSAVLTVVYPHMCSPGGDAFWLIHPAEEGRLRGLNASGRAPYAATRAFFEGRGLTSIPLRGLLPVTVPGVVDGWGVALRRYGTMSLAKVLEPAVGYAQEGFPISAKLSRWMEQNAEVLHKYPTSARVFLGEGGPARPGKILRQEDLARSLRTIGQEGCRAFYRGRIAEAIVRFCAENGGLLSAQDLVDHRSDWVEPIGITYRGHTIYEFPPSTQGLAALLALNIVEGFDLPSMERQSAEYLHLLVEAKKLAFADRDRYISDPDFVEIPVQELSSMEYAAARRASIDLHEAARQVSAGHPPGGDTVYLCVVDRQGNAVSLIQSIYFAFGCGVVVGDTGIILQNRGAYFSLDPSHVNRLEPHKRPFHTLTPAMVFKDDQPYLVLGTMGGDGQPQTHLQIISNIVDFGLDVQEAIEAPRWLSGRFLLGDEPADLLSVEGRFQVKVLDQLVAKGHRIEVLEDLAEVMGHAQAIMIAPDSGVLMGRADPRGDGVALGW